MAKILNINMDHIKDYFHCVLALSVVIFNDSISKLFLNITNGVVSLFFTYPEMHDFLMGFKDIVSTITVTATCILMCVKLVKLLKSKKWISFI